MVVELSCWARVKPIRVLVVNFHLVDFDGRLIKLCRPGLTTIVCDVGAAIISLNKQIRIIRIDPHVMIIAMGRMHL